jgi:VWFA-related protein
VIKSCGLGMWGRWGGSRVLNTAAGVGALLVVCAGAFQLAAQAPQPPTFRAGVNVVRVDVIVNDKKGAFVSNLTPDDFEITEEGKPQKIETFKLISLDGGLMDSAPPHAITSDEDEAREAARDDVRLFGIFLDDYHVTREASLTMRDQIARFIAPDLGPSDMVGLMYPLQLVSSVLMTRNHDAVQKGIEQFLGRKGEYEPPKGPAEETAWLGCQTNAACIEGIRDQVAYSALEGLIVHLGGFKEGRKTLILVTEGFSNILRGSFGEINLQELYTEANRNNVSVYWVDPRGLGAMSGRGSLRGIADQQDALKALSLYTDGRAIINRNDLTMAMKDIVRDSSGYYLLGYNSTFSGADGKFHEINVRVKRSGVDVRARKGYWALSQQQAMSALAPRPPGAPKEVEHALADAAAVAHARPIRTWVGVERGDNAKAKVTFVWEPAAQASGATLSTGSARSTGSVSSTTPARVVLTALGADGHQYFRGNVQHATTFDAPPGKLSLRLSVEAADATVLDTETREIPVPDVTAPVTWLSTPQVFRARTAREAQQIKSDPAAAPLAGRAFSREDRLLIRVEAYGPGQPTVTARLLNHLGQTVTDVPVAAAPSGPSREIDLALANLTPGDYLVELDAAGGGEDVKELVAFQVN